MGWAFGVLGIMDGSSGDEKSGSYRKAIKQAEDYMERGLYQKAIVEYEFAVEEKNKVEDWSAMMAAYESRYQEDEGIIDDYITALKKAINEHKKDEFYQKLTELCMEDDKYSVAYNYLEKAYEDDKKNEIIEALYYEVKYSCKLDGKSYSDMKPLCNDHYAVASQGQWGILNIDNSQTVSCDYNFIGSMNEEDMYIFSTDTMSGIIDSEDVLQGKYKFVPEDTGIFAEDLVAIKINEKWAYYDLLGDKQFGEYTAAGTFQDGKAAVCDGKEWMLIDKNGKKASDSYEEIRLNTDGTYIKNSIMLAKKNGTWKMYDEKEKEVGKFSCDNLDVVTDDELIAFEKNSLWGFVNLEGEVVIEPEYTEAKSFSEGLAGVSKGTLWGFIDENNRLVIENAYAEADYFNKEGNCMVKTAPDTWQLLKLNID